MRSKRHRQHTVKSRENMRSLTELLDGITWFEEMNPSRARDAWCLSWSSDRTEGNRVSVLPRLHRPPHCKINDIWTESWVCSLNSTWSDQNTANNTNSISRQHLSTAAAQIQHNSLIHILMTLSNTGSNDSLRKLNSFQDNIQSQLSDGNAVERCVTQQHIVKVEVPLLPSNTTAAKLLYITVIYNIVSLTPNCTAQDLTNTNYWWQIYYNSAY